MASASNLIFIQTQFLPFKVVGSFISILVLLLWLGIFIGTAYKSIDGSIFISPAFDQWKVEQEERNFSIDDSTAGVGSSSSIK